MKRDANRNGQAKDSPAPHRNIVPRRPSVRPLPDGDEDDDRGREIEDDDEDLTAIHAEITGGEVHPDENGKLNNNDWSNVIHAIPDEMTKVVTVAHSWLVAVTNTKVEMLVLGWLSYSCSSADEGRSRTKVHRNGHAWVAMSYSQIARRCQLMSPAPWNGSRIAG